MEEYASGVHGAALEFGGGAFCGRCGGKVGGEMGRGKRIDLQGGDAKRNHDDG